MERVAIYPGTFDPITLGHMDIITRGAKFFDRLIVAVAISRAKNTLFPIEDRVRFTSMTTSHLPKVEVQPFEGLLVDYARSVGAGVIVRGLRAVSDFEYEFQMATMNHNLEPEVETVLLMAGESTTFVSSRLVKEVASVGGDVSRFVPKVVEDELNRIREQNSR